MIMSQIGKIQTNTLGFPLNLSRDTKNNIVMKRDRASAIKDRIEDLQSWRKYLEQSKET